MKSFFF